MLPTRTLYGKVLLCIGLTEKNATQDHQMQFVMKKVEAQVKCSSYDTTKTNFCILSLQFESVTIVI